ncbi:MAG TPA: VOC family protein [Fimbriimonas sp.]|nr:VOC family protein [Fimbriimonas sp.]
MNIAVPNLPCLDLSQAKDFYVGKLGFGVVFEAPFSENSGLVGLELDGMRINLDAPMEGHGRQACVSLEVDDIDSLYARWSQKLPEIQPPVVQSWGAKTFGFQDPDDNTIFVLGSA